MKTMASCGLGLLAVVIGLGCVASGRAKAEDFRVRGVSAVPGFPSGEIFVHDTSVKRQGVLVNVKPFLNHEADIIDLKGKTLVFTSKASADSVNEPESVYGKLEVTGTRHSGVFVFLPCADKEVPGTMVEIDDGKTSFPAGAVMVVNHSAHPLQIELGEETFDYKAGESRPIRKFPEVVGAGAPMKASVEVEGEWTNFSTGLWPSPGTKRVVQIVYDNARTGRVEIRGIRDVASVE